MDGTLSYTFTDPLDSREKIHFCDPAWTHDHESADDSDPDPDPDSVDRDAGLDHNPTTTFSATTTKMNAFLHIVLREIVHSVERFRLGRDALKGWELA